MSNTSNRRAEACAALERRAFSLIELLVTIGIISLLVSIGLPAMGRAREQARVAVCITNLHDIGRATQMYINDDGHGLLPWYTYPKHCDCPDPTRYTPWVFGGFMAPDPLDADLFTDASLYPTEIRPLNSYISPGSEGLESQIEVFKCPSDSSSAAPLIGDPDPPPMDIKDVVERPSWIANGSSYSLNTRFMQGYNQPSGDFNVMDAAKYGEWISPHLIGGKASRFVLWVEQGFYARTYRSARDLNVSLASPRARGWHGEYSKWSAAFADGHVTYGYFDSRVSDGPGWTLWEPR